MLLRLACCEMGPGHAQAGGRSVAYIMPAYRRDDRSHFAHLPHFLDAVARRIELHVVVERGVPPDIPHAASVTVQQEADRGRVKRSVELLRIVKGLRRRGCQVYFVRISQGTALLLNLARPFLGRLELYYWNSGATRPAWPGWRQAPVARALLQLQDLVTWCNVRVSTKLVTGPEAMLTYYMDTYRIPARRCVLLPNDIDVSRFSPVGPDARLEARRRLGLRTEDHVLLFVGRLSPYKGGRNVAPIVDALRSIEPTLSFELLVAGDMHEPQVAATLAQRREVRLLGPVPNLDLPDIYRAADVFVLPSNAEGFPRVLLEAMAAGLPIVAFDVGGVRDLLSQGQQEFVVPPRQIESFAQRVAVLLREGPIREALREENQARARAFDTEVVAEMFVERIARA